MNSDEDGEQWIAPRIQKKRKLESLKDTYFKKKGVSHSDILDETNSSNCVKKTLFDEFLSQDRSKPPKSDVEKEEENLRELMVQDMPLVGVAARAHGLVFTESLKASWKPPSWAQGHPEKDTLKRKKLMIDVIGEDIPAPLEKFEDMKFPRPIIEYLYKIKNIKKPSPIQMQGLPVILSGRDMIGIASTGSGKTLVFAIPAVIFAMEEELRKPLLRGEGPFCLILCPSRELAFQTHSLIMDLINVLCNNNNNNSTPEKVPFINAQLIIGGTQMNQQASELKKGCHIVVATTGRLIHWLKQKKISLLFCKYLCLDEADRLIDSGFEEDLREILDYLVFQHQTVLFSATMPKSIQNFAITALVRPVEVNVGRAGVASLNITQEVEYVVPEAKITYLLDCLQKTSPPVLIFCENKSDVDDIHEYLLLKGVQAVAIHGRKNQSDRINSIKSFREGKSDVLIATDVASKGLDFPKIQHVINYDMPRKIENYIHRIGRTGRGTNFGIATTFINKNSSPIILADLKQILIMSKQKVPPFLVNFELEGAAAGECECCGGLGHTVSNCPKAGLIKKQQMGVAMGGRSDYGGSY